MIRALTIRFVVMCAGAVPLIVLANVLNAPPALVLGTFFAYMGALALIIDSYCAAHQDEIPTRAQHRDRRH
jgi:hypothetical protein